LESVPDKDKRTRVAEFSDVALRLHADDSVAVSKRPIIAGTRLENGPAPLQANQTIPPGHKIALVAREKGAPVLKYGQTFGFASEAIAAGDHVHTHNVELGSFGRDYAFSEDVRPMAAYAADQEQMFKGFLRRDGRVGTRNYVAVISSVNCSASVSKYVAEHFANGEFRERFPNIDGVIAFKHTSGCANDPGEPTFVLQRVLAGIARHPNVGGYLLIGLGCEVNQVQSVIRNQGLETNDRDGLAPISMEIQSLGGIRKTITAAVAAVEEMLPRVNAIERSPQPLSKLTLAMNCGGSDGNSGITANPALGFASDELVRHGASTVLAETPEIYGAEHLLTRRAITREIGEKLIGFVHWWEEHAAKHGVSINNNPSTGNKTGGLTTIYEKSLGAVAKGGRAPLSAVYRYADQIDTPGFCFMDTPGFDPVSMTGLVAGGCNVGVFTTGRGSVYGCKPSPSIKIATNTPLYHWMEEDMDLNAGTILDGTESVEEVGQRIFDKIVSVANGEQTKSELAGVGDEEFAPWILGSVL
jgi:altronate dehydratase